MDLDNLDCHANQVLKVLKHQWTGERGGNEWWDLSGSHEGKCGSIRVKPEVSGGGGCLSLEGFKT